MILELDERAFKSINRSLFKQTKMHSLRVNQDDITTKHFVMDQNITSSKQIHLIQTEMRDQIFLGISAKSLACHSICLPQEGRTAPKMQL